MLVLPSNILEINYTKIFLSWIGRGPNKNPTRGVKGVRTGPKGTQAGPKGTQAGPKGYQTDPKALKK